MIVLKGGYYSLFKRNELSYVTLSINDVLNLALIASINLSWLMRLA